MAAWCRAEAQRHTYQDSGWTAVRVQELRDRRDGTADHIVYQSVVAFPDAARAHEFFSGQETEWKRCDDRRVDLQHDPGDPAAHYWSLNTATDDDGGVLTITRSEVRGPRKTSPAGRASAR